MAQVNGVAKFTANMPSIIQAIYLSSLSLNPIQHAETIFQAQNIHPDKKFESWEELRPKSIPAQAAIICTPDHLHSAPTLAMLDKGLDVLLERKAVMAEVIMA